MLYVILPSQTIWWRAFDEPRGTSDLRIWRFFRHFCRLKIVKAGIADGECMAHLRDPIGNRAAGCGHRKGRPGALDLAAAYQDVGSPVEYLGNFAIDDVRKRSGVSRALRQIEQDLE